MKLLSSNTKFNVVCIKLLILLSFLTYNAVLSTFLGPPPTYEKTIILISFYYFIMTMLNLFCFSSFWKVYKVLKIHRTKKACSYLEIMDLLKTVRITKNTIHNVSTQENKNSMNIVDQTVLSNQEQRLLQGSLERYAWLRNSHSQKGVNALFKAFLLLLLLLFMYNFAEDLTEYFPVRVLAITMLVAGVLCFGFAIFGMAKVLRGRTEVA